MSRPFAAVEGFLERILERPAARLFRARPQPVQLERRIERAMTAHRMVRGGHTYVPSRYRIFLHPSDLIALQEATDQLPNDLADAILSRARAQGYWLVARPEVFLVPSPRLAQGELEVDADPLDPSLVSSAAAGLRPVGLEGPRPPRAPIPGTGVVPDPARGAEPEMMGPPSMADPDVDDKQVADDAPAAAWLPLEASPPPPDDLAVPTPDTEPNVLPIVESPRILAVIEVRSPDGLVRMVDFTGGTVRAGRGTDNEIVILDERVSRHHGRFTARQDVLVYTDQDSTNGSLVNGLRVREVGLGVGDVVRLGRTTLTIRPRP
jgi:hypothetical protein